MEKRKQTPTKASKVSKVSKAILMTHTECINFAASWLSNQHKLTDPYRCKIILREMVGYAAKIVGSEFPDVLGIWGSDSTVNIECKVTRSDFLKDTRKKHNHPYGHYKLYACPVGMIRPEEVPEHFGLIYLTGRGGQLVKHATKVDSEADVVPLLSDLVLNGVSSGVLTEEHKKRHNKRWHGKGVIL